MDENDFLLIGKIVSVHGLKGALKVISYAESNDFFTPGEEVFIPNDKGAFKRYEVTNVSFHKRQVRLSVSNVLKREDAESLIGSEIYIPKNHLCDLDDDEYYWTDLIGMDVYSSEDEGDVFLGKIESIFPTGSNDVYVVMNEGSEILVPALSHVVLSVDVAKKTMHVRLPEGL